MALPIAQPPSLPVIRQRAPQENIPASRQERDYIRRVIKSYVEEFNPVPPMPMKELQERADELVSKYEFNEKYRDYIAILMNNEAWSENLAKIPFERRLLLLPKCLRDEEKCPAPFDEFGLLCKQCGLCSIQDLENEAERLGYAILVAEGSTIVMKIIESGKIEAIVGVSCLNVLEKSFPYMEAAAIPGIAIPLLQDDCADCTVDLDWVWDTIHLTNDDKTYRLDLDKLREEVSSWFTPEYLDEIMGEPQGETEQIARGWLMKNGKRWRPFLAVCAHQALQDDPEQTVPDDLKRIAVAVECFHKASLIHDDIEDGDCRRYGEKTLHEEYSLPVALNAGDLLIGEGYRILAQCTDKPETISRLVETASAGQRKLCQGQGSELCWAQHPEPLASKKVLEIFSHKTAPAFEVALRLGAVYAGADKDVLDVITTYSEALGIAYQIRDDLEDWNEEDEDISDLKNIRPSLILAMAHERSKGEIKEKLAAVWKRETAYEEIQSFMDDTLKEYKILDRAERLKESYKEQAIFSLKQLDNLSFKGLLRRVIGKIFNDIQIKGWCSEFETRNATNRQTGS